MSYLEVKVDPGVGVDGHGSLEGGDTYPWGVFYVYGHVTSG